MEEGGSESRGSGGRSHEGEARLERTRQALAYSAASSESETTFTGRAAGRTPSAFMRSTR